MNYRIMLNILVMLTVTTMLEFRVEIEFLELSLFLFLYQKYFSKKVEIYYESFEPEFKLLKLQESLDFFSQPDFFFFIKVTVNNNFDVGDSDRIIDVMNQATLARQSDWDGRRSEKDN